MEVMFSEEESFYLNTASTMEVSCIGLRKVGVVVSVIKDSVA